MAINGDRERTAHLLRRFGLGASQAEVDYYSAGGWRSAVDRLLGCESVEEPVVYTTEFLKDQEGRMPPNPIQTQTMVYAWLMTTNRPLQAKMTLFWHDHFATSCEKVSNGPAMYKHWNTLWDGALGKFESLLLAVSKDPAMLYWLDNIDNVKGTANENFARELLELFTLGVDQYSEADVQAVARAFTGWSYGFDAPTGRVRPNRGEVPRLNSVFVFDEGQHDSERKSFKGQTKSWTGEEVIQELCKMSRTAFFLVEKIWSYFAYANPARSVVERHAQAFLGSGLDIKTLLRGIMLDEEFYSDQADRKKVKNPVDYCVSTLRQLGVGAELAGQIKDYSHTAGRTTRASLGVARTTHKATEAMGMALLLPPDVSGWPDQLQWVSTSTMVERIKWCEALFGVDRTGQANSGVIATIGADAEQVVDTLLTVSDASVGAEKRQKLVDAVKDALEGNRVTRQNQRGACLASARLLFSTPEFQLM